MILDHTVASRIPSLNVVVWNLNSQSLLTGCLSRDVFVLCDCFVACVSPFGTLERFHARFDAAEAAIRDRGRVPLVLDAIASIL